MPADGSARSTTGSAIIFYVPAVAGGIFGLLGGYLTDLFGRRRVLVWSILLYALSALRRRLLDVGRVAALLALLHVRRRLRGVRRRGRVAGGAVSRIPKQREAIIGYTQAFGSLGGIMATGRATTWSSPTARSCRESAAGTRRGATR